MRGLIAGSALLAVLAFFLLVLPAIQLRQDESAREQHEQALILSNIAQAFAQSTTYRILVAEFYSEHGYFPSHIDEIDTRTHGTAPVAKDESKVNDIGIANHGDVILRIRDANDAMVGTVILTAQDDERTRAVSWECHTTDFKAIRTHFPQCRYKGADR